MGLISILFLGNREARGERDEWSSQNTDSIYQLSLMSYMGMARRTPKQLQ